MLDIIPIPSHMRAAVLSDSAAVMKLMTIATPVPKRDEALIRVAACGLCHTDLHVMRGDVAFPRPAVLGHEVSGTVVQLGEGTQTDSVTIGDAVVGAFIMPCTTCDACRRGRDDLCAKFFDQNRLKGTLYDGTSRLRMPDGSFLAMYSMGGLAEYCVVPVSALARVAEETDLEAACILGCAGLTSFGAVFRTGMVEAGQSVVVIGAGGVGSSVIQMARAAGASQIVAIDIADEKLERAVGLGATQTINSRTTEPVLEVRRITRYGADVVFEALGIPQTFRQATEMLADGGRMVAIGIAAGRAEANIEITPLVRRGYTIAGSFGGRTRTDLPRVVDLATSGAFDAAGLISTRFSLTDINRAFSALARGDIAGRAIISMSL